MVERRAPLPKGARREALALGQFGERRRERVVVAHPEMQLRGAELPHVSTRAFARRDMEIIRIQDRMRGAQDDRVRLELRGKGGRPPVCGVACRDFLLFSSPDLRQNDRRMRDHDRTDNRHLFDLPVCAWPFVFLFGSLYQRNGMSFLVFAL